MESTGILKVKVLNVDAPNSRKATKALADTLHLPIVDAECFIKGATNSRQVITLDIPIEVLTSHIQAHLEQQGVHIKIDLY